MLLICPVCHEFGDEPIPIRCDRCGRVTCARCSRCGGWQRIVCPACDSTPTPEFAYPGDAAPHPHVDIEDLG
jgi:hypothetical protein